eukprot:15339348-Ditylum_brightwellii.AAC.1
MTGVGEDMDTEAEDKNEDDASGVTKMTGMAHRNEEQEEKDESDVTGMTGLPVTPENNVHLPNKATPTKLDFNGSLRNVPTKTRKDNNKQEEDHDNNRPDMDEHEEDQMAEELDNDGESVMKAVTRIQLSQEKQKEDEDNDKTGTDTNKMQDMAHGLCVAPKLFPVPCQILGCKNKLHHLARCGQM